jgi:1-acyl-sn-glycerol-3-phosphate acyltransferase
MLAIAWTIDLRVSWMGKHTLFKPPFGGLLKALGGIPVDRRAPQGIVGQMVDTFAERKEMVLVVPPEGTRGRVEYWKSGFYEIAKAANVPIVFGFLDYGKREGGIGSSVLPSGDVVADMDEVRSFYADKVGHCPDQFSEPRLKAESFPKPRVVGG